MKITKTKLRQIIKEEIKLILEYERYVYRHEDGELRIKDKDGRNDELYSGRYPDDYDHLKPGGEAEKIVGADDPVPDHPARDGDGPGGGAAAYGDGRLDPHGFDRRRY